MVSLGFSFFLFLCSCLLYSNTLWGSYVWDDRAAIIGNDDVTQVNALKDLFVHDFWGQDIRHNWSHKSYRPITTLSFRANHALHGLNAAGYHLVNVLIYAVGVVLMYKVCKKWCSSVLSARIAGALYCFHPVHVEAVASLVGRADSLCGLFFMATLIAYSSSMQNWTCSATSKTRLIGMAQFALALLLAVAASLSKEIGVTIFGMVVILEVANAIQNRDISDKKSPDKKSQSKTLDSVSIDSGAACTSALKSGVASFQEGFRVYLSGLADAIIKPMSCSQIRSAIVVCTLAVLSVLRVYINGPRSLYQWTHLENHIHHLPTLQERVLSYAQSHYWYLLKLFYPRHLCFDYGFACIPTIHSLYDVRNLLSLLAYGSVSGTVYCAIRYVSVPLFVGLGLLVIPLIPALNILFPVGTTLAERLLFIPSAGYCLMMGEVLTQLNSVLRVTVASKSGAFALPPTPRANQLGSETCKPGVHGILHWKYLNSCLFTAAVCAMFSVRVFTRNRDWNNEAQIYKSALQVCPLSAKALTNYAVLHMYPGQFHNSVAAALASVEVYAEQSPAWLNAGVAQQRLGFQARSAWYYDRSLQMNRGSGKMLGYLGVSLYEWAVKASDAYSSDSATVMGLRRYAAYVLDRSLAGGFAPPTILHTRGSLAMDEGEFLSAIKYLEEALRLTAEAKAVPDVPHADLCDEGFTLNQLGNIYSSLERYEDAFRVLSRGLEFSPKEVSLLTNIGSALRSLGRLDEARSVLLRAVDVEMEKSGKPSIATLNNLGLVELDAGLFDDAALLFQKAITTHEEITIRGTLEDQDYKQLRSSQHVGLEIGELLAVNLQNARNAQERLKNPARLLL